jgi:ATP-dependent DNA helicase RecQ
MATILTNLTIDSLKEIIAKHWGFPTFRPLQEQAMRAVLEGKDSLVVLPTGGGKSLCYQAPAVLRGDTTVVVSPLISLMKDQVDSLRGNGVAAIQMDSSQTSEERHEIERATLRGDIRLLFVAPERLVLSGFQQMLRQVLVRVFAIDEAHCISHWGHDFRPEYRQLKQLKELFPQASVHAYTATATERVRRDIVEQLGLKDPEVLVGNFDRPNLAYRVVPRNEELTQVRQVLDRHKGEAGIIYCIRRKDVDELTPALQRLGYKALPYHAGMAPDQRKAAQDAFAEEKCDLIVATVAFGMGIDRSNIRFVLHTAMPKSVEHYQQETGRAGRDGLEAECVLLHSGADFMIWKFIIEKSAAEPGVDPAYLPSALKHLKDMNRYCQAAVCRHKALVQYFGQTYSAPSCESCDSCLGDGEPVPDSLVIAQKILSCVARVEQRFGVNHVAHVLHGRATEAISQRGHDKLSTFGLLQEHPRNAIQDWIRQLIGQGALVQEGDDYPILRLNDASWEVMKGKRTVRLVQSARRDKVEKSSAETTSWEGVDRGLFEALRLFRTDWAEKLKVAAFVIFSDATLRELARVRPSSLDRLRLVYGIGESKLRQFGPDLLEVIQQHCGQNNLAMDVAVTYARKEKPSRPPGRPNLQRDLAFDLFRQGAVIEDVMHQTQRGRNTVIDYLCDFIRQEPGVSISKWLSHEIFQRIASVVREVGRDRLKPIFIALGEKVSYDEIRIAVAYLERAVP